MRLSEFIIQHKEQILKEWQEFAQTIVPPAWTMNLAERHDHASYMLDTTQSIRAQFKKSRLRVRG